MGIGARAWSGAGGGAHLGKQLSEKLLGKPSPRPHLGYLKACVCVTMACCFMFTDSVFLRLPYAHVRKHLQKAFSTLLPLTPDANPWQSRGVLPPLHGDSRGDAPQCTPLFSDTQSISRCFAVTNALQWMLVCTVCSD